MQRERTGRGRARLPQKAPWRRQCELRDLKGDGIPVISDGRKAFQARTTPAAKVRGERRSGHAWWVRVVGWSDHQPAVGLLAQNALPGHAHPFPGTLILRELAPSQERPWREKSRQWAISSGQGLAQKKPEFFFSFFQERDLVAVGIV